MGENLCILGKDYQALGAKSQFFDLKFYWKPDCSISGSKVMAKKAKKLGKSSEIPLGIIYKISNEDILTTISSMRVFK